LKGAEEALPDQLHLLLLLLLVVLLVVLGHLGLRPQELAQRHRNCWMLQPPQ
jgi:hypothetical protein